MNKKAIDIYNEINIEKAKVRGNWIHLTYDDGTYEWRSEPINFSKMFSEEGKWSHYGQLEIGKFISDVMNNRRRKSIAIENVYAYNNKVVVVKFKDGTKIRSIFDGDGEFSVYNGIAICIAKKLIGNDGTKIFNDSMRAAMKIYRDKESKKIPNKDISKKNNSNHASGMHCKNLSDCGAPRNSEKYYEDLYHKFEAKLIDKLRKYKNMSCSDISDLLDIPESAVRSYLERENDE